LKLATTAVTTLTLALTLCAAHGSAQNAEVPSQPEPSFFDTPSVVAVTRDNGRTFGAFRAASLDFAHGATANRDGAGNLAVPTWQQPFGPSLTLASRNASAIFATIDLGNHTRPEPKWKTKDALTTGFPPHEKGKNHLGEAIARGMLGFVIGRAVAELAGDPQARKSYVKVRSAADPHGKGVGLGLSASW
jgi:hypothetical protein